MRARGVVVTWLCLMVLLAVEVSARALPGASAAIPFVGAGMAVVVAMTFMRLSSTPGIAAAFALAGAFWLCVMMGLTQLDYATRQDVAVTVRTQP